MFESDFDGGYVQVVYCAIFKGGRAIGHIVFVTLHRCDCNGPAREPGTMQFCQGFFAGNESTQPSGVTEYFVERDRYKIRMNF